MSALIRPATHSLKFARSFSVSAIHFGINKLILVGKVSSDPYIIEDEHGPVAKYTLVTSETNFNKEGNLIREKQYHIINYNMPKQWFNAVKKGDRVYVEAVVRYGELIDEKKTIRSTNFFQRTLTLLAPSPNKEENEKK